MPRYYSKFIREKLGLEPSGIDKLLKQMQEEVQGIEQKIGEVENELKSAISRIKDEYQRADENTRRRYEKYSQQVSRILNQVQELEGYLKKIQNFQEEFYTEISDGMNISQEYNGEGIAKRIRRNSEEAKIIAEQEDKYVEEKVLKITQNEKDGGEKNERDR
ncbi:MAG: hypothetical protein QXW00_01125 [Candidatus Woesearchaeota archaeon]